MIPTQDPLSKDNLLRLLNLTDDRISYVDKEYVYRAVNQTYVSTFNRPIEQIIGKKIWEVIGKAIFETTIKPKLDRAFQGEAVTYESWFEFESGERAYLIVKYIPIYDDSQEIAGVAVTASDITARKKLEDERVAYEKLLLDRERTAQLGDMLAMIAHEWRTPLHTLSTYLLRLYETESQNSFEILRRCEELIGDLSNTINEIHSFYQTKPIETLPLIDHIRHALALMRYRMKKENVQLCLDVDERCTYTNHSAILIHLFVIFLDNALDALSMITVQPHEITIQARCDSDFLCIDIIDNGEGIADSLKHTIFDPGFSTKGVKGTGYGLYIAKKIVCDHLKGEITLIDSSKGAHFRILFPAA